MDKPSVPTAMTSGPRTSPVRSYQESRSTGLPDRPNQHRETITRLDGSVSNLNDVNQERRQRSVYGRDPTASDPKISNEMMAALPKANTRYSEQATPSYTPEAIQDIQSGLDSIRQQYHNPLGASLAAPQQQPRQSYSIPAAAPQGSTWGERAMNTLADNEYRRGQAAAAQNLAVTTGMGQDSAYRQGYRGEARPQAPATQIRPEAPQQRVGTEVPGRPGYYVPPGESPYSPAPSLSQRFSRAVAAEPVLTEDLMAAGLGYEPSSYNEMRARRASGGHTLPQPPARSSLEGGVEAAGKLTKQLMDPIGYLSALGGPLSAAVGGAAYEGAKESLNQRMRTGSVPEVGRVVGSSLSGGAGGALGAHLFRGRTPVYKDEAPSPWPAVVGRVVGANTTGNVVNDAEAGLNTWR